MSFVAFVWAWEQPVENAVHQHVLLALADTAPVRETYASASFIAAKIRRSERHVRSALAALEAQEVITITDRPGKTPLIRLNIPSDFRVTVPPDGDLEAGKRGRPRKTPERATKNPGTGDEKPSPRRSDEPLEEPKKEPISSLRSESVDPRFADLGGDGYGDDAPEEVETEVVDEMVSVPDVPPFDRFWAAYPRRTAKGTAREAWAKKVVKAKVDLEMVIRRAGDFAEAVSEWPDEARRRFLPHAATWLNQGRWDDDMDHVRRQHAPSSGTRTEALRGFAEAHHALAGYDE